MLTCKVDDYPIAAMISLLTIFPCYWLI